ncbi:MAG: hypothetical protein PHU71_00170 [Candidatus Gracilibacteria bacterium]|nr:hypothetical protein [Candidatus Gracilibacteria bacterium]
MNIFISAFVVSFLLVLAFSLVNFYHLSKYKGMGKLTVPSIYLALCILAVLAIYSVLQISAYYLA